MSEKAELELGGPGISWTPTRRVLTPFIRRSHYSFGGTEYICKRGKIKGHPEDTEHQREGTNTQSEALADVRFY